MANTLKTPSCSPNIAILGAGAIGQLMYHQLCHTNSKQPSNDIALISRQPQSKQQQLQFTDHSGYTYNTDALILGANDTRLAEVHLLLVCVKAYQVATALLPLLSKLSPQCHIVLLHNGLGPHLVVSEALAQYPNQGLTLGTTSQAALKNSQWHIKHTGFGVTQLGYYCGSELSAKLKERIDELHCGNQAVEWHQPVLTILWQKLAINAVINPLTALHHCANGQLANDEYQHQIAAIIEELVHVAKWDGIVLDRALLSARVYQVIKLTAANYSSMYQDVAHHRATEINFINGYICQQAQLHRLAVPHNQHLLEQVLQLSLS